MPSEYTIIMAIIGGFCGIIVTILTIVSKVMGMVDKYIKAKKEEDKPINELRKLVEAHINTHLQLDNAAPIQKQLDEEKLNSRFKDLEQEGRRLKESFDAMRAETANVQAGMYTAMGSQAVSTQRNKKKNTRSATSSDGA